jgi:hypothetical protein
MSFTLVLNSQNVMGSGNNTYKYDFIRGNFTIPEDSEIIVANVHLPYSFIIPHLPIITIDSYCIGQHFFAALPKFMCSLNAKRFWFNRVKSLFGRETNLHRFTKFTQACPCPLMSASVVQNLPK